MIIQKVPSTKVKTFVENDFSSLNFVVLFGQLSSGLKYNLNMAERCNF